MNDKRKVKFGGTPLSIYMTKDNKKEFYLSRTEGKLTT